MGLNWALVEDKMRTLNVNILFSTSVPFRTTTVQVPNYLALNWHETDSSAWTQGAVFTSLLCCKRMHLHDFILRAHAIHIITHDGKCCLWSWLHLHEMMNFCTCLFVIYIWCIWDCMDTHCGRKMEVHFRPPLHVVSMRLGSVWVKPCWGSVTF